MTVRDKLSKEVKKGLRSFMDYIEDDYNLSYDIIDEHNEDEGDIAICEVFYDDNDNYNEFIGRYIFSDEDGDFLRED